MKTIEPIQPSDGPAAIGPYSPALKYGDLVFCSGQIPIDKQTGQLVSDDIAEQTRKVLKNLEALLESADSGLSDILKTTIFLANIDHFKIVNEVYGEFFKPPYPARATIEVSKLPMGALVEIEAVAKTND